MSSSETPWTRFSPHACLPACLFFLSVSLLRSSTGQRTLGTPCVSNNLAADCTLQMSCGQIKRNSEHGDAHRASRQMRTVAGPRRRVWKCVQARSAHRGWLSSEPQGADRKRASARLPQSLLFLLGKLGLLQDLNVQSSKPDVLILFTDLAIGFVAFIEKQLFKGPYSTVLELDPS